MQAMMENLNNGRTRIRLGPLIESAVSAKADEAGMSFSEYVRSVLFIHFKHIGLELKQEWGMR